jgi:hypothetical protein
MLRVCGGVGYHRYRLIGAEAEDRKVVEESN